MTTIEQVLAERPPTVGAMFLERVAATPDGEALR